MASTNSISRCSLYGLKMTFQSQERPLQFFVRDPRTNYSQPQAHERDSQMQHPPAENVFQFDPKHTNDRIVKNIEPVGNLPQFRKPSGPPPPRSGTRSANSRQQKSATSERSRRKSEHRCQCPSFSVVQGAHPCGDPEKRASNQQRRTQTRQNGPICPPVQTCGH